MKEISLNHKDLYPVPSHELLKDSYQGVDLDTVSRLPAAILDKAIVERNCKQMLKACQALGVLFRPHVKTHKTVEVTQLQVGDLPDVNIVVSTVVEAEHLTSFLKTCQDRGKNVNILYGVPLPPISAIKRLAQLGKALGPESISVMVDNAAQLQVLPVFEDIAGFSVGIFVKIDVGYGRAGLPSESPETIGLLKEILDKRWHGKSHHLHGFYSHAGDSYSGTSSVAAMDRLVQEIEGLQRAVNLAESIAKDLGHSQGSKKYVLSVGATPTATSIENLMHDFGSSPEIQSQMRSLRRTIALANANHSVELHAGVYPILDLQQLSTKASPSSQFDDLPMDQKYSDIALTILVEVASLYPYRNPPEALVAAGSLALGREPCKAYDAWGIVSSWDGKSQGNDASGWAVARISQEHGILKKVEPVSTKLDLQVGQRVRIWPNHACIAGAGFDYYLIVDSSLPGERRNEIVDVWVRCRGW